MAGFATLPFEDQVARIREVAADGGDPHDLLREAGSLPDAEPLALLVDALVRGGRWDPRMQRELASVMQSMPDAALQHLLVREPMPATVREVLATVAEDALGTWPLARISALSLLVKWLRQRVPEVYVRVERAAEAHLDGEAPDGRWLLLVSGTRLAELSARPEWSPTVKRTVELALDALAHAPKSISQANAETLLARRVYANRGHFFFELLQNADDARATRWSARLGRDHIVVRNDGAPFSFRDVVGLLSIGQTTKEQEQIGFFGVGFKSIYEVCERPRVHSGPFDFEIAHVSIPRLLTVRPAEADGQDTVLVLPLREEVDADALLARARAMPPETLLTLPHVREVAVEGSDGASWAWTKERGGDMVTLRRADSEEARRYRCVERRVRFEGQREEGRSRDSPVLVAVAVSEGGTPAPPPGATLFAFLPTSEHTGLRTLVHARFDVTLDRERLEQGSPWNATLLTEAGRGVADAVMKLVREGTDPMPLLPGPAEVAPVLAPLMDALRMSLSSQACLRAASGHWLAPGEARLVEPRLAQDLAEVDLGEGARALAPLGPREQQVALHLGATPFTATDLVRLAQDTLRSGTAPPAWLTDDVLDALGHAPVSDAELEALPLLTDGAGNLLATHEARVGAEAWATLYAGLRAVVAEAAMTRLPASLRGRLRPATFDPAVLASDLADAELHVSLMEREGALLGAVELLGDSELAALGALPILRTTTGTRVAIADGLRRLDDALAPLAEMLASFVAMVDPEIERAHPKLVTRWVPRLGLSELADVLLTRGISEGPAPQRVLAVLDREAPRIGRPLAMRFASAPLFPDVHGQARPLVGPGRALRARDAELRAALPEWPWLAADGGPFVDALDSPLVGATALAAALTGEADLPPVSEDAMAHVLEVLTHRAQELPARTADRLADAPIWLDAHGRPRPLEGLRPGDGSAVVTAFFDATGTRSTAHPVSLRLATALRVRDRLPASDLAAAVRDLARADVAAMADRALLAQVLAEAAHALPRDALVALWAQPLFKDESGTRRPLARWDAPNPHACHRAGPFRAVLRAGRLPLLSAHDEVSFAGFLEAAGPGAATAADVVRHAHGDDRLVGDASALRKVLAEHGSELDEGARILVADLPIFRDATGTCRPARHLCTRGPFAEAGPEFPIEALADGLLDPQDESLVLFLELPTRAPGDVLADRVLPALKEDAPLSSQPAPWRTRGAVRALLEVAHAHGVDVLAHPLCLDVREHLVRGPLAAATTAARELLVRLGLSAGLADAAWAGALSAHVAAVALEGLPPRRIVEALRAACPDEAPLQGHPVLSDPSPLYAFLRDTGTEIGADAQARGALAGAAVVPSQRGTLRAPRELVLDPSAPDLGLAWGMAADVPADVARWLASTYELDRQQRETLVQHVLDGLDEAAGADDAQRASDLVRFLGRALGATIVPPDELERRARRSKVRDRLKVPLEGGGWDKPRRAWAASEALAAQVDAFCLEPPPRIALPHLDSAGAVLLVACGARGDLDEDLVDACLRGEGLRAGSGARIALAQYVASRALQTPALKERWKLAHRAWVPTSAGELHRPGDLLCPDELSVAMFGEGSEWFPDPRLFPVSSSGAEALGFRKVGELSLREVATLVGSRPAPDALLAWIEEGLRSERLRPSEVRDALQEVLLLRDDEGQPRPVRELAFQGARSLFGASRGDWSDAERTPRLAEALRVPHEPDAAMVVAFLREVGASFDELSEADRADLARHLPDCLEQVGEWAETGHALRLPRDAAVAGLRGSQVVITRLDDPALCMLEPAEAAEELSPAELERLIDPLPTTGRSEAVARLLRAAGVPSLEHVHDGEEDRQGDADAVPQEPRDGALDRLRRWIGGRPAPRARAAAPSAQVASAAQPSRASRKAKDLTSAPDEDRFFRAQSEVGPQLGSTEGWLDARREQPLFGFAFTPPRLPAPWLYAPKLVATRFDARGQQWRQAKLERPDPRGDAGLVLLRGRLPAGDAVLPVPTYGKVVEVRLDGADGRVEPGDAGASVLRLDGPADVRLRVSLGRMPDLDGAQAGTDAPALQGFVPDADLPDEVHDFLANLDAQAPIATRALAIRDFIRDRYRYDPTYLEDPGVGRWLARVTHGRANAHVAALHAGRDDAHLGAGVCYELNTLACELMRRAGIPAAIATGWVLDGGSLSEPDHMWAVALLAQPDGSPLWLPIDASTTRAGRPLRVPRRPPGRFRAPRDPRAKVPSPPSWHDEGGRSSGGARGSRAGRAAATPKKRRPPRAELLRVLHHLEKTTGRTLTADERAEVERALSDPRSAKQLLDRLVK
jgi:transglutaminase-like putative cysteine protease